MRYSFLRKFGSRIRRWIRRQKETPVQYPSRIPIMLSFLFPAMALVAALFILPASSGNADVWRKQEEYLPGTSPAE
jgi:hypothetical protein